MEDSSASSTSSNAQGQDHLETQHSRKADIRHAAVGGLTNFLQVFGALSLPIFHSLIVWAYGPVIYGLYSVGAAAAETFGKLGTMGTDKGLWRYIAAYRISGDHNAVHDSLKSAVLITTVVSVGLGILVFILSSELAPFFGSANYAEAIAWLAPSVPLFALISTFVSATLGAKILKYNLFVRGVAQPFLLVIFALIASFIPSLVSLSIAHIASLTLSLALAAYFVRKVFKAFEARDHSQQSGFRWELLSFSIPLGLSEFLNTIMHRAGLMILAFHLSAKELAAYAACEMLVRAIAGIRNTFDPVISPVLSEAIKKNDHDRMDYNLKLVTRWVVLIAIPILFLMLLFSSEILSLLNKEFSTAGSALALMSVAYGFTACLGLNGWVLVMGGYSWLVLVNNIITAGTTIGLGVLLIPKYGIMGGALATSVSVVLAQALIFVEVGYLKRTQPLSFSSVKIIGVGVVAYLFTYFASEKLGFEGEMRFFVEAPIYIICFLVLWRLFAFEEDDLHLLQNIKAKMRISRT